MDRELEQWKAREVARILALVETERRYYQEIVASIPVGILILSSDLSIVSSNREVRRLFGLRSGEPMRGNLDHYLPAEVIEKVQEALDKGTPQNNITVSVPGEPEHSLRVSIRQIGNWDGEPLPEALVTVERAPAETPLPAPTTAGMPVGDLLESLDAVIWAAELSSKRFLYVNANAVESLGYSAEHWLSSPSFWMDRIHPSDRERVLRTYEDSLSKSQRVVCEFQALNASGGVIWLRESVRVLQDEHGAMSHVVGLAVDVTQRHLLDAQFVQAQRVDAVNRLSARLANEITNQAMIVAGYSEDMLAALESKSPLRTDLREIQHAAERLRALAMRMTAAHRTQAATPEPLDAADLLKRMEPKLRDHLGNTVHFEMNVFPPVLGVCGEQQQLEQAITAFADRARAGLKPGDRLAIDCAPVEIDERTERLGLHSGVYAVIKIEDSGPALAPEARSALFDGSFALHEGGDDPGLAMARAYRVIRQWGGDIAVSSKWPVGTVVEIYLPRAGEPPAPAAEPEAVPELESPVEAAVIEAPVEPPAPRPQSILVVEAEGGIRTLIQKMLRRQGYHVLDAADAPEALKICEQNPGAIDLLIADISIKSMAETETLQQVRHWCPEVKSLYLAGDVDDQAAPLPPDAASLAKPFTLGSLINKVKELLSA